MKKVVCLVILLLAACKSTSVKKTTVWMIGDSTMADKTATQFPETGWGTPFSYHFDASISVQNQARDGFSTQMFIEKGCWQSIFKNLKKDDYIFIQFGHNDESEQWPERYTPPEQFKLNLIKFITDARSKIALPILITPVARRKFNDSGNAVETHPLYSGLVTSVATEYNVPMIDLDGKSMQLLDQLGREASKSLYLILKPGQYSNYPSGIADNTHFNEYGAQEIAQIVLEQIQDLNLPLANRIIH
jgi:lysophospholipase L1-like esterase